MKTKHYRERSEKIEIELDFNQKQDEDYDGVVYSTDP